MDDPDTPLSRVLKVLACFAKQGLLSRALYSLLKQMLFCGEDRRVLELTHKHDLSLLLEPENIEMFMLLFHEIEALAMTEAKELLSPFFSDTTLDIAHQIASFASGDSTSESMSNGGTHKELGGASSLVYGEIEFDAFTKVLEIATSGLGARTKFVDLGSGIGKALMWVCIVADFGEILGFEIIEDLWKLGQEIQGKFEKEVGPLLRSCPKLEQVCGNFLEAASVTRWVDADLVFANSTCFSECLLDEIAATAFQMKVGARFISFTLPLKSKWFKVLYKERLAMSWGPCTVFVQERTATKQRIDAAETPPSFKQEEVESYEMIGIDEGKDGEEWISV